ncbi:MAG: hypothetical protein KGZ86_03695 [Candidatus Latescibacteria bacterium]|nr:hypothetical protein [Candidatus Latescibacterota bacterium]
MKKLTIALILLAVIFIVGCQAPQDVKAEMDKQAEQIKMLETKLAEHATAFEQLKMDYEQHMVDLHKKTATPTQTKTTTPQPPTRVGR